MSELDDLSPKQQKLIQVLDERERQLQPSPTYSELAGELGLKAKSAAHYHARQLVRKGLVQARSGIARGLQLTNQARELLQESAEPLAHSISIPLKGVIGASGPHEYGHEGFDSFGDDDVIAVDPGMLSARNTGGLYALRVTGDSMIDAMVVDGDVVIMRQQEIARDGDMVAVWLVADSATTLKYIYREKSRIRLQPANPAYEPIYVDDQDMMIQGHVVGIVRKP